MKNVNRWFKGVGLEYVFLKKIDRKRKKVIIILIFFIFLIKVMVKLF